jgi:hypothetical protein
MLKENQAEKERELGAPNELRCEAAADKVYHRNEERERTRRHSVSDCKTPGMLSCCANKRYSSSGVSPLPRRFDQFNDQLAQWPAAEWRSVGLRRYRRAGRGSHRPCDSTTKPVHKGKRNKDGERQRDQRDEGKERETQ